MQEVNVAETFVFILRMPGCSNVCRVGGRLCRELLSRLLR